jgi:hypothetical protein
VTLSKPIAYQIIAQRINRDTNQVAATDHFNGTALRFPPSSFKLAILTFTADDLTHRELLCSSADADYQRVLVVANNVVVHSLTYNGFAVSVRLGACSNTIAGIHI